MAVSSRWKTLLSLSITSLPTHLDRRIPPQTLRLLTRLKSLRLNYKAGPEELVCLPGLIELDVGGSFAKIGESLSHLPSR